MSAIRGFSVGLERTIAFTEAHTTTVGSPARAEAIEVLAVWRNLQRLALAVEAERDATETAEATP